MKNSILIVCLLILAGCANDLTINDKTYKPYGLINQDDVKIESIKYKPCWGNIIWGCVLIETIIGPIYFFGFAMFEPIEKRSKN